MNATRERIDRLTAALAKMTDLPLELNVHNPGEGKRYRIYTIVGPRGGASEKPFGDRSYTAAEMVIYLDAAVSTAEAMQQKQRAEAYDDLNHNCPNCGHDLN